MSLVAIYNEYGLSRRTIQGYEKEGLVKYSGKTKMGHLLYDERAMYRVLFIRYCQNIGFSLKEIKAFIDESNEVIKQKIESMIPILEKDIKSTKKLIVDSRKIVELLDKTNCEKEIFKITRKGDHRIL